MIEPGTQLGAFEIIGLLGMGGMGEVYRARDSKLGREVAIKVLPQRLSTDAELLARFQREAQTLATLNHSNIATVHGFDHDSERNIHYLIMELIDGMTLAEFVGGNRLDVERAIPLFIQMANGLDAAHEAGIVHRDLKPDNVKINEDGVLKILDFGLAKAAPGSVKVDPNAPTTPMSPVEVTAEGTFMGTPMYMSPEQARGKEVDKRTDIWAFGCCLYEVLSGTIPFKGETVADTVSQILEREPDWDVLPEGLPWRLTELIQNCLQKDQRRRVRDIGDVARELESILTESGHMAQAPGGTVGMGAVRKNGSSLGMVGALILGAVLSGAGVWGLMGSGSVEPETSASGSALSEDFRVDKRFTIDIGNTAAMGFNPLHVRPVISPDGRRIVYAANLDGVGRLYMRNLNELEASVVPNSDDALYPFFSPDSRSIGFSRQEEEGTFLYTASLETPKAGVVCEIVGGWGYCWLKDGTILFSSPAEGLSQAVLYKVSLARRTPEAITQVTEDGDELYHMYPTAMANSNLALFQITYPDESHAIGLFDAETLAYAKVVDNASYAKYVESGHIVFVRANELWAIGFDLETRSTIGKEYQLHPERDLAVNWAKRPFSLSNAGAMVFLPEPPDYVPERNMVWVDRRGIEETVTAPSGYLSTPRMSPDGTRIGVNIQDGENIDIWMHEVASPGSLTRVTFDRSIDRGIVWYPQGLQFMFSSFREGGLSIFQRSADGFGEVTKVLDTDKLLSPIAIDPQGRYLTYMRLENGWDIGLKSLDGDESEIIVSTPSDDLDGEISPDGDLIVYASDDSGEFEVFVRPFPEVDSGKWQISRGGGKQPKWSLDGSEIFYRNGNSMMTVPIVTSPGFRATAPEMLFEGDFFDNVYNVREYDLEYPEGERFLMVKEISSESITQLIYVENWLESSHSPASKGGGQ